MLTWFDEVENAEDSRVVGADFGACEQRLEEWLAKTNATLEATDTATREGQQLIGMLKQQRLIDSSEIAESVQLIESMLNEIEQRQHRLKNAWQRQRHELEVAMQFRLFCQDCCIVKILES